MLKSIIFFLLSIVALFSYADETKRWNIIKDIVNKELGSNTYVQTIESNFQDSINVQPYDSVCIQQAIRAWDGFIDFASNFAELTPMFHIKPEELMNHTKLKTAMVKY